MSHKLAWSAAACGLVCAPGVAALEYNYGIYSSAEYTDNIRQGGLDEDRPSGSILVGGIDFEAATTPGTTFAADVSGDFSKRWYSDGDLDAEDRKFLDAAFVLQPSSSNFQVAVLESLRQVAEDRRLVRDVNNVRDVNVFSVVPSYIFDLTSRSSIRTTYSYSRIDEELEQASREINTATVGYEYKVSNLSTWSLNVSQSDIEFSDVGSQYDQESAFFRWTYLGDLTNWALDLGQQRIVGYEDAEQPLVNFSLDRQINNYSTLALFYSQGYSDAVDNQVGGRLTTMVPNSDAVYADDLAKERQLTLSYGVARGPWEARIALDAQRLESEEAVSIGRPVDEDNYIGRVGLDYRFRSGGRDLSNFGIGASYRYMREEFNLVQQENEVNEAAVRFSYFATRTTDLFFELRSRDAAGTSPQSDSDENSALIGIRFSPRGG